MPLGAAVLSPRCDMGPVASGDYVRWPARVTGRHRETRQAGERGTPLGHVDWATRVRERLMHPARRRSRTTVTVTKSAPATPTKKTKDEKTIVIKTSGFIGRGLRRRCARPCRHKRSIPSCRAPFCYCQPRRAHAAGLSGSGPISTAARLHDASSPGGSVRSKTKKPRHLPTER